MPTPACRKICSLVNLQNPANFSQQYSKPFKNKVLFRLPAKPAMQTRRNCLFKGFTESLGI